jgi:hypothetical protein
MPYPVDSVMLLKTDWRTYRWIEDWVKIPESALGITNGRTHGVVVTRAGQVVIFHQADPAVLIYSPEGRLLDSWGAFPGAHGLTLVEEDGVEFLWLVDQATKQVVKTTLEGKIVQTLEAPVHKAYPEAKYVPTWLAVNEKRFGGNGDLWLADGYGAGLVHCYDAAGRYLDALDGSEGAGRFKCPHGLALDVRRGEPEIYIADRGNKRFQVYGVDRKFRRVFGEDFLTSPDVSAGMGEFLIVPELVSRLSILDRHDQLVAQFGLNDSVAQQAGWPNQRDGLCPGKFNSPHSAAADALGNIYVVEWMIGGRIIKLEKTG